MARCSAARSIPGHLSACKRLDNLGTEISRGCSRPGVGADLAGAYDRVVADLGTLYTLAYRPTNKVRDGAWRTIRVNVNRPNAIARGKRGYFAK